MNSAAVNMVCKYLLVHAILGLGWATPEGAQDCSWLCAWCLGTICGVRIDQLHSRQAPSLLYWPSGPRTCFLFFVGGGLRGWGGEVGIAGRGLAGLCDNSVFSMFEEPPFLLSTAIAPPSHSYHWCPEL